MEKNDEDSCGQSPDDEDEGRDEPPQNRSREDDSSFFDADLSELLFSPTLPAKQGVQRMRRSHSCDGRLQGSVYFHSTPLHPGHGLLNIKFQDDTNLIYNKINDIKKNKNRRQTMTGKTDAVTTSVMELVSKKGVCELSFRNGEINVFINSTIPIINLIKIVSRAHK